MLIQNYAFEKTTELRLGESPRPEGAAVRRESDALPPTCGGRVSRDTQVVGVGTTRRGARDTHAVGVRQILLTDMRDHRTGGIEYRVNASCTGGLACR